MIDQRDIDLIIPKVDSDPESYKTDFVKSQENFFNYISFELLNDLTPTEKEYLLFICLIIYNSCGSPKEFDLDLFFDKEETNWGIKEKSKNWSSAANQFFEGYAEEDLLAFVEDMLSEAESLNISQAAAEIIFVTSKSYIDTLTAKR